jgi:hypothetical protein
MKHIDIDDAARSPALLGAALGDPKTWETWLAVLKGAFGLKLSGEETITFASVAGARKAPEKRVRELWAVIGRRSGKSRIAALVATYLAVFADKTKLSPGEIGSVLILAASKAQANAVFSYVRAFFEESAVLRQLISEITADEIRLKGNVVLSVHTANFRTIRGRTLLACVFDEVGYWRDEQSTQPDIETYRAVLPALATTAGMLIAISSPYAQRGLLYTKHQQCYGKDDAETLVVQAPTTTFNATIGHGVIDAASESDPEAARAEWFAEFRGDLSTFVERSVIERCVEQGCVERSFQYRYKYFAHIDPSGGQNDSMTVAIAHREGDRVLLDLIREWKAPFSPDDVTDEMVKIIQGYRITAASGDAYAAQWVQNAFRQRGIAYTHCEHNRSELYLQVLPLLTSAKAVLLDHPRMIGQIAQLERRTGKSGRDAIDHMRGAHDDLAVAAAGALVTAMNRPDKTDRFSGRRGHQRDRDGMPKVNNSAYNRYHGLPLKKYY